MSQATTDSLRSVRTLRLLLPVAAALALTSCGGGGATSPPPPPPGAIAAGQSIGSASLSGRVTLSVPAPPREKIRITEANCHRTGQGEEPMTETVVAGPDGSLRNVIVHVKSGLGARVFAPPGPATLDQKGCIYVPHVIAVQANQVVSFVNSDPTLHNLHAVSTVNPAFNIGMNAQGQKIPRWFSRPEIVKMKCDVHSWMSSYIGVFDNPFHVVTAEGGRYDLKGLPAGTYEIEAWQESYGTRSQSVTLADGESKILDFSFGG